MKVLILLCAFLGCVVPSASRKLCSGDSDLCDLIALASHESEVPEEVLLAVAFAESRLRMRDGHGEAGPVWGMFQLRDFGVRDLSRGAAKLGATPEQARKDVRIHVRVAAALLADAWRETASLGEALDLFGGYAGYGDHILRIIARGFVATDDLGRSIAAEARPAWRRIDVQRLAGGADYPAASWVPAYAGNYQNSSRGPEDVDFVVIHTTQGSYAATLSWFQDPTSQLSSHFVVRSSDGDVTQMVKLEDIAYHDGCFNLQSVGIEHEGLAEEPEIWFTEAMYRSSAAITAWLVKNWSIPVDRSHILGHGETPDCSTHWDPGPGWDWDLYMDYIDQALNPAPAATLLGFDYPSQMRSGETYMAWVEYQNDGGAPWGNDVRLGTSEPRDRESPFFVKGNWIAPNRATGVDDAGVPPDSVGRFTFLLRAPDVKGETLFTEHFALVQEGHTWFGPPDDEVELEILVHPREGGSESEAEAESEAESEGEPGEASGGCACSMGGAP